MRSHRIDTPPQTVVDACQDALARGKTILFAGRSFPEFADHINGILGTGTPYWDRVLPECYRADIGKGSIVVYEPIVHTTDDCPMRFHLLVDWHQGGWRVSKAQDRIGSGLEALVQRCR